MLRYGFDADAVQAGLRRELERAAAIPLRLAADSPLQLPSVKDPERLLDILVLIVPPMKAIALDAHEPDQSVARGADRAHLRAAASGRGRRSRR